MNCKISRFGITFFMALILVAFMPVEVVAQDGVVSKSSSLNDRFDTKDTLVTQEVGVLDESVGGTSSLFFFDGGLWTCNDHGNLDLYQLDTATGEILHVVHCGVVVEDLEAVTQDEDYLYFGDFGDNRGVRTNLRILKLKKDGIRRGVYRFDTISFFYPEREDRNAKDFDCEAFFCLADSLYLLTKQWNSQRAEIYSIPKQTGHYSARRISSFDVGGLVTDVALFGEGRAVVLGYSRILRPFVWICEGFDGANIFGGKHQKMCLSNSMGTQAEAVASIDGRRLFFTCEYFSRFGMTFPPQLFRADLLP